MNSLKIFCILLFLGFISGACEKFTDPGKDNQYTNSRVIKEPGFSEGILTYAYMRMQSSYVFEELATDDAVSNQNGNTYQRMATGEWSPQFFPTLTESQSHWATAYSSIYNLNYFLSIFRDVEWSRLDPARNARFIIAFSNALSSNMVYIIVTTPKHFIGN